MRTESVLRGDIAAKAMDPDCLSCDGIDITGKGGLIHASQSSYRTLSVVLIFFCSFLTI